MLESIEPTIFSKQNSRGFLEKMESYSNPTEVDIMKIPSMMKSS